MRLTRFVVPSLVAVLLGGCAVPDRNNPHDPTRTPKPAVDLVVGEGGRFTVFILDASPTALTDTRSLEYFWEIHDPALDTDLALAELEDFMDTGARLERTLPLVRANICPGVPDTGSCVGEVIRNIRLRVVANGHYVSEIKIPVRQRNRAPVANFGPDLFVATLPSDLELTVDGCGGVVVSTAAGISCTTTDPDDDPVEFTGWRRLSGPNITVPTILDARRATFTFLEKKPHALLIEAEASDDWARTTARLAIYRSPQVWVATQGPGRVYGYFRDFTIRGTYLDRFSSMQEDFPPIDALGAVPNGGVWVGFTDPLANETRLIQFDETLLGIESRTYAATSRIAAIAPLADGRTCVAVDGPINRRFLRVDPFAPDASLLIATRPAFTFPATDTQLFDDCWAVTESEVFLWRGNNTSDPLDTLEHTAAATVSGDLALWVSETTFPVFAATDTILHRYTPAGDVSFSLPGIIVNGLAAHWDGTSVWALDLAGERILKIDAAGTVTPQIGLPPMSVSAGRRKFVSQTSERALWVADASLGYLYRLVEDAEGILREESYLPLDSLVTEGGGQQGFAELEIDSSGAVWTVVSNDVLVHVPQHMRRIAEVSGLAGGMTAFAVDPASGALWGSDPNGSGALVRTGVDGDQLQIPDTRTRALSVEGDGSAWYGSEDGAGVWWIRHVDSGGVELASKQVPIALVGTGSVWSLSAGGGIACGIAGTSLASGDVPKAFRYDPAMDVLEEVAAATVNRPRTVAVTSDGTCWFAGMEGPYGGYIPSSTTLIPNAVLLKVPLGTTAPEILPIADCGGQTRLVNPRRLVADPRPAHGVWIVNWDYTDSRVVHVMDDDSQPDCLAGAQVDNPMTIGLQVRECPSCINVADVWVFTRSSILRLPGGNTADGYLVTEILPVPVGEPVYGAVIP